VLGASLDRGRVAELDVLENRSCRVDRHFRADAAGHQLGEQGLRAAVLLGPPTHHFGAPLGQQPAHRARRPVDHRQRRACNAASAMERPSLTSVFVD
jgi:hypothetical protein